MKFLDLPLKEQIQQALTALQFETATEIQEKAIPKVLEGQDVRGVARTGTGKTAAFLLPALQRFAHAEKPKSGSPKVLILVPTRELGQQIDAQLKLFCKYLPHIKHVNIGGGVPLHEQRRQLEKPHTFLIATPGRLLDFIGRKKINLNEVELLILDEADRMLDMGFVDPVREIVSFMPKKRQTLLFTATLHKRISDLSNELMINPVDVMIEEESGLMQENIKQVIQYTNSLQHKNELLDTMLQEKDHDQVIIFTSTKRHADQLANELKEKGYRCAALHGDMYQKKRVHTLSRLRKGEIKILVATDVAARGIDVKTVTHVVNFDLPYCVEDYVHRIGRTGRAGASGTALSFAAKQDLAIVKRIEKYTGRKMDVSGPDFQLAPPKRSKSREPGRHQGPGSKPREPGKPYPASRSREPGRQGPASSSSREPGRPYPAKKKPFALKKKPFTFKRKGAAA